MKHKDQAASLVTVLSSPGSLLALYLKRRNSSETVVLIKLLKLHNITETVALVLGETQLLLRKRQHSSLEFLLVLSMDKLQRAAQKVSFVSPFSKQRTPV